MFNMNKNFLCYTPDAGKSRHITYVLFNGSLPKENPMYQKPEVVKHEDLSQVTFSSH